MNAQPPGDYDPWVDGWLLGKYGQASPWHSPGDIEEWIEGFRVGCAEVGEHHLWERRLECHLLRLWATILWDMAG